MTKKIRLSEYEYPNSSRTVTISRLTAGCCAALLGNVAIAGNAGVCVASDPYPTEPDLGSLSALPLININQFEFKGGFTLPPNIFGESQLNFAEAVIAQSGSSLFIVGNVNDDAVAEFTIPNIVNSTVIRDLNSTGNPVQTFSSVLDRSETGNSQGIDQIMGMAVISGQLVINADEFYDAPANNTQTTLVVSDASDIAGSTVKGFFNLPGASKSAGWITKVPTEWQAAVGGDHLAGSSAGTAIIGRHSVGPTAHILDGVDFLSASINSPDIATTKLLEYSLENPLDPDLYNDGLANDVWTITSRAKFGFIVPGTRTYATFGWSSGHESGLGYKIAQDTGYVCGGPCSVKAADSSNFYWFFDMNDLLAVKAGTISSYSVRPYAYGNFTIPYQTATYGNPIAGGAYDQVSNTLYLSVQQANNTLGTYDNPPVIAAFTVAVP